MEEKLSEPDEDSLAEDFDLKENSLLLRKQTKIYTATNSDLGCVAREVDNTIYRINHCPVDIARFVLSTLTHWIAIYSVDNVTV